jgi:O-antigen/teichoic acid export membrane protein
LIGQRILRAAIGSVVVRAVSLCINVFLTPFTVHALGDTQYGLFVLISSFATQGALLDLGISPAVVKYVAETKATGDYERGRSTIATALSLYCALGIAVLFIAAAIAPIFPNLFHVPPSFRESAIIAVLLMGAQLAISIPTTLPEAILLGSHRYVPFQALMMLATLLAAASTVAVLLAGGGIVALFGFTVLTALIPQALGVWLAKRLEPEFTLGWRSARRGLVKQLLSYSLLTFIIQAAYNIQTQIDEIVIGVFLPVSSVGAYYVARRVSAVPQMISQPILSAFLPLASQLNARKDADGLRELYLVGTRAILAVCIPLLIVVIMLAGPLLTLWVGGSYAANAPVVVILALASVLEVGYWPGRIILQGVGQQQHLAKASVFVAVANLGLSILLVRYYGVAGVALGTLIPAIFVNLGYIWPYTMRSVRISGADLLRQALVPVLVPALPMTALLYAIIQMTRFSGFAFVVMATAASVTIYAAVYLIFFANVQEREWIANASRRLSTILLSPGDRQKPTL